MLVPYCSFLRLPRLGHILSFPAGWESVFVLGCIAGYPVGAQCVCQGYAAGALNEDDARRMIPLCCNCGPSFLFGIVASVLESVSLAAAVWMVCVLSSFLTALLISGKPSKGDALPLTPLSLPQAVQRGCKAMISVCAWIILGKVVLSFLPDGIILSGLLEMTNGCLNLVRVCDGPFGFVLACVFCAFGGICVCLQVYSLCDEAEISGKGYLGCKLIQAILAAGLAGLFLMHPVLPLSVVPIALLLKLTMEKTEYMMYNTVSKGGIFHVIPKKDAKVLPVLHSQHKTQ